MKPRWLFYYRQPTHTNIEQNNFTRALLVGSYEERGGGGIICEYM